MAEFLREVIAQDETPTADGTDSWDLPIYPLSHLILTVKVLNDGVNVKATLAQILGALEKIEILRYGSSKVSVVGTDLYALNCYLLRSEPWQENVVNTDNAVRYLSLYIPFGRKLFNPDECFPATARGELKLQIQYDIADTGYDGLTFQIEAVSLPEAKPKKFLKYTTLAVTPTATGEYDIDLPIGNEYAALLVKSTTIPTATSWTTTVDWVKFIVDGDEKYYSKANWESLHGDWAYMLAPAGAWAEKFHMENLAATYTQYADTATEEQNDTDIANYSILDFDPNRDGMYVFNSAGKSEVKLRINAGDTNEVRVIPIELEAVK